MTASLFWRNLRFTLLVPLNVAVVVPLGIVYLTGGGWPGPRGWSWAGVGAWAAGVAIYAWTVWSFALRGRGTPAPWDPPRRLVVSGAYRFSRNPMYVGVLTTILGHAIAFRSWWVLGWLVLALLVFSERIVGYEEPVLAREFGSEFEEYRRRVGRWLTWRRR